MRIILLVPYTFRVETRPIIIRAHTNARQHLFVVIRIYEPLKQIFSQR